MTTFKKCYGPTFRMAADTNPHPSKAHQFDNPKHAMTCYEEFVAECDNLGMGTPGAAHFYYGEPDGDEEQCGYPDSADFIFDVDDLGVVEILDQSGQLDTREYEFSIDLLNYEGFIAERKEEKVLIIETDDPETDAEDAFTLAYKIGDYYLDNEASVNDYEVHLTNAG